MNKLSKLLHNQQSAYGMIVTLKDPAVVEMLGHTGYDFAIIDMEHTTMDFGLVEHMIRAAECVKVSSVVRTPQNDYGAMLRVLEAGADAIMVPHLTTREQAERIVGTAKYRPIGSRGLDGSSRIAQYGTTPFQQHLKRQNERVTVIGMIEDESALTNLDDIVSVAGLDLLFVGPADLAASFGCQEQFDHPIVMEAIEAIVRTAREAGLGVGIPAFTAEEVDKYSRWGANFFTIPPIDTLLFSRAMTAHLSGVKQNERLSMM
ncbi:HpcH/HpaI aldolase family protein [Paenibacillus sabinae]|uniref:HpcH/HpaI aldolase n=1 Tax=Paenibacillus sabinae T27 TaxID=1268072 RepID=X4ZTG2_9BACL|nr:aldolase/citrate lyase family protein [Paenibacillus sabinae]AHV95678.1 HpcH/HpaI aldolase [Paenibacillus sabinae T27]